MFLAHDGIESKHDYSVLHLWLSEVIYIANDSKDSAIISKRKESDKGPHPREDFETGPCGEAIGVLGCKEIKAKSQKSKKHSS